MFDIYYWRVLIKTCKNLYPSLGLDTSPSPPYQKFFSCLLYVISLRCVTYDIDGVYHNVFICSIHLWDGYRLLWTCHILFGNHSKIAWVRFRRNSVRGPLITVTVFIVHETVIIYFELPLALWKWNSGFPRTCLTLLQFFSFHIERGDLMSIKLISLFFTCWEGSRLRGNVIICFL